MDDLAFVLRLHLPKGDVPSGTAVGVGDIKDMSQLVGNISVDQQRDAFRVIGQVLWSGREY